MIEGELPASVSRSGSTAPPNYLETQRSLKDVRSGWDRSGPSLGLANFSAVYGNAASVEATIDAAEGP